MGDMANSGKMSGVKKKNIRKRLPGDLDPITGEGLRLAAPGLLSIPLAILFLLSVVAIIQGFSKPFPNSLTGLLSGVTLALFALPSFSVLYVYRGLIKSSRHVLDTVVACILSLLTVVTVLFMSLNSSSPCMFAGGTIDCNNAQLILFYVVFFNPFVLPIATILSLTGIISLLRKQNRGQ